MELFAVIAPDNFRIEARGRMDAVNRFNLKTAVKSVRERQGVVAVALCTAPHLTKTVKSSMFATVFALNHLTIPTHFDCRF